MLDIQKHKFILVQILKDIYSDKEIGKILGFKGGTAAYLFYDLPRFSIDLYFNLLAEDKKDLVFKKIKEIVKKYAEIKEAREKRFTLFFLLSYEREAVNVKIEISKRAYPVDYKIKSYLGIPMLIMQKQDMVANKLVALLERKSLADRDLFDLWYFLKNNWEINKKLVEIRTEQKFKDYLRKCIKSVEAVPERYILQGLGELLDERQKIWAKKNLKKELLFLMRYYLRN